VYERFGHVFVNNLLTCDKYFKKELMKVWQLPELCDKLNKSPLKQMDYNVYVKDAKNDYNVVLLWGPTKNEKCEIEISSLTEMQKVFKASSVNSKVIENNNLPMFKSCELGNYQLLQKFPAAKIATKLPTNIQKLLGLTDKYIPFVGAYPVK
jgi:hypothetical protein